MRRRAFTMIELVITVALTGIVVGVVAGMFGFASIRLSDAYAQSSLSDQVTTVANLIEESVRDADSCTMADAGGTLICAMPINGIDTDADGRADSYYPDKVDANGREQYTVGGYLWYFNAGANGSYNSSQTGFVTLARSNSATVLKKSDNDAAFSSYPNGKRRYPLVTSVSFSVNSAAKTVTYSVIGSSRMGSSSTDTSDASRSRALTITRTIQWRN